MISLFYSLKFNLKKSLFLTVSHYYTYYKSGKTVKMKNCEITYTIKLYNEKLISYLISQINLKMCKYFKVVDNK